MSRQIKLDRKACEKRATEVVKNAGITRHPVRVDRIAKSHGIKIRYEPLDDELSGMIFYKNDVAVIGLNARHSANRQRFTIAHELGHFFLHNDVLRQGAHVDKVITMLRRDQDAALGIVNIEVEANQFAAELLMPKHLILSYMKESGLELESMSDEAAIQEMARSFMVSTAAIGIRLGSIY